MLFSSWQTADPVVRTVFDTDIIVCKGQLLAVITNLIRETDAPHCAQN